MSDAMIGTLGLLGILAFTIFLLWATKRFWYEKGNGDYDAGW